MIKDKDMKPNEEPIKEEIDDRDKSKTNKPISDIFLAVLVVVAFSGIIISAVGKSGDKFRAQQQVSQQVSYSSSSTMEDVIDVSNGRFEIINEYTQNDGIDGSIHYYIAYDKVTKVIYTIGKASGSSPTFTVMVGETGTPILYGGKDE